MITPVKNIFLQPGQIFRVVRYDEPLQPHFLVREMYEDPHADAGWDTIFKSKKWLGTAWHTVEQELPAWIGKSYNDLNEGTIPPSRKFYYEIIEIFEY
jgi:hypothetical protein